MAIFMREAINNFHLSVWIFISQNLFLFEVLLVKYCGRFHPLKSQTSLFTIVLIYDENFHSME
jgi:hypothetical protein